MPYARIRVSFNFLRDALHLPKDTVIKRVRTPDNPTHLDEFEIIIAHPDLENEEPIPIVYPTFLRQEPVVFVSWNQPRIRI